jgi:hypothetical protein
VVKSKLLNVLTIVIIFVSVVVGQNSSQSTLEEIAGRQVRGINLNRVTTMNALTSALGAARVPGGVATITACESENYDLAPVGSTLKNVLDAIVVANPQLRWFIDDGVVNLVPRSNKPTLLDTNVANFEGNYGKTQDDMLVKLLAMPEVKEAATRLQLTEGFSEIGLRPLARPGFEPTEAAKGYALHLQNATVREILNALVRAHGSAIWSYQEKRCGGPREFSIRFVAW